jgi:MerR family transcriptional regulator, heat shock protein HspR
MPKQNEPLFSISVTARLTGSTPRSLRIYEDAELISPYRTGGNTRLYSQKDLEKLEIICYLHKIREVNLQGIKLLLQIITLDGDPGEGPEAGPRERLKEIAPELAAILEKNKK